MSQSERYEQNTFEKWPRYIHIWTPLLQLWFRFWRDWRQMHFSRELRQKALLRMLKLFDQKPPMNVQLALTQTAHVYKQDEKRKHVYMVKHYKNFCDCRQLCSGLWNKQIGFTMRIKVLKTLMVSGHVRIHTAFLVTDTDKQRSREEAFEWSFLHTACHYKLAQSNEKDILVWFCVRGLPNNES